MFHELNWGNDEESNSIVKGLARLYRLISINPFLRLSDVSNLFLPKDNSRGALDWDQNEQCSHLLWRTKSFKGLTHRNGFYIFPTICATKKHIFIKGKRNITMGTESYPHIWCFAFDCLKAFSAVISYGAVRISQARLKTFLVLKGLRLKYLWDVGNIVGEI